MFLKNQLLKRYSVRVLHPMSKSTFLTLFVCTLLFVSCNKEEEFKNLNATISGESTIIGTEEGNPVIANVLLSEELSEDLTIQTRIRTEGIISSINPDDYDPVLEYSNDLGKTWVKAVNQNVIFKQETLNLKIRIRTIVNNNIEYHEKFSLNLTPKPNSILNINGDIPTIHITVNDNEPTRESFAGGALYEVDENYNFTLVGLNRKKEPINEVAKSVIDNGMEPQLIEDITKVTQSGPVGITTFEAMFEQSGLGGFVINQAAQSGDTTKDDWIMALNLYFAYFNLFGESGNPTPQEYNNDGAFGAILVHEYGHIMTLNAQQEINKSPDVIANPDSCTEYSTPNDGCFLGDSVLNQFNNRFYDTDTVFNEPHFVSGYAGTNIYEDLAESFIFQVMQNDIPPLREVNSGARLKMNFMEEHPHLDGMRDKIRSVISNVTKGVKGLGGTPVLEYNLTKDGRRISCTDHKAILEAHRKKQFVVK